MTSLPGSVISLMLPAFGLTTVAEPSQALARYPSDEAKVKPALALALARYPSEPLLAKMMAVSTQYSKVQGLVGVFYLCLYCIYSYF